MSQYPSPYVPPSYQPPAGYGYGYGAADLLAPARGAMITSIALGLMALLCTACLGGFYFLWDNLSAEQLAQFEELEAQMRGSGVGVKEVMLSGAIITLIAGLALVVLGVLVRGGRLWAIVTLIVFDILLLLVLVVQLVGGLVASAAQPQNLLGACVLALPLALAGLLMYFLVRAARNVPQLRAMQAQQQAMYWQFQQNQQMYGGGYPYPPPPPPPQQPPPPSSSGQQGPDAFDKQP
jgi:hypothetical protein